MLNNILDFLNKYKRINLIDNKFENLYYHLVDERTQYFAGKNWQQFKIDAISDLTFSLIINSNISPIPINKLFDFLYDFIYLEIL